MDFNLLLPMLKSLVKSKRFWISVAGLAVKFANTHGWIVSDQDVAKLIDQLAPVVTTGGVILTKMIDKRRELKAAKQ